MKIKISNNDDHVEKNTNKTEDKIKIKIIANPISRSKSPTSKEVENNNQIDQEKGFNSKKNAILEDKEFHESNKTYCESI